MRNHSSIEYFPEKAYTWTSICDEVLIDYIVEVNSDLIFSVKFVFSVESDAETTKKFHGRRMHVIDQF